MPYAVNTLAEAQSVANVALVPPELALVSILVKPATSVQFAAEGDSRQSYGAFTPQTMPCCARFIVNCRFCLLYVVDAVYVPAYA